MEGIDAAHAIKASDPQVGVVILSQYADEEKHVNAIFSKLRLSGEQAINRRVAAVLTFLREAGLRPPM
jgi:hypothetical protein